MNNLGIVDIVNAFFTQMFLLLNSLLISAVGILWGLFIYPFLDPNFSFPHVLDNGMIPSTNPMWIPNGLNPGYETYAQIGMDVSVNLNVTILNFIVAPFFSIFLIISAISYLFDHFTKFRKVNIEEYLPRIFFGIVLAYLSLFLSDGIMDFSRILYNFLYSGLNIVWNGQPSPFHGIESLNMWPWNYFQNFNSNYFGTNGLLEFFILLALVSVMLLFTIALVMRIVWIYFLIIFLPVGSLFLMHPRTERIGKKIWISLIDRSMELFFMSPVLILLAFIEDPLFWISIFAVALLVPRFVSFALSESGYPLISTFMPRIFLGENITKFSRRGINSISNSLKYTPKFGG